MGRHRGEEVEATGIKMPKKRKMAWQAREGHPFLARRGALREKESSLENHEKAGNPNGAMTEWIFVLLALRTAHSVCITAALTMAAQ